MKKNTKIWINILLDESGSMAGSQQAETMREFNAFIAEQKKVEDAQILATLTTFSDEPKHIYIARPVKEVPKLTEENYNPTGCTALYDAIAASMKTVDQSMRREDENTGVLFVIISDGGENSSREFSRSSGGLESIKKMIADKKKENWTFVFMGADIDGWQGQEMGIHASMGTRKANTKQMYDALSKGVLRYACSVSSGNAVGDQFFELNPEDYKNLNE